jgi:hypothetical protein
MLPEVDGVGQPHDSSATAATVLQVRERIDDYRGITRKRSASFSARPGMGPRSSSAGRIASSCRACHEGEPCVRVSRGRTDRSASTTEISTILAVLDAIDVGASDLHRRADAAEPFSHEQCNALVAGEHVEQLEFVLPSRQWSRNGLDASHGGVLSRRSLANGGAAGVANGDVLVEVGERLVPVATSCGGDGVRRELDRGTGRSPFDENPPERA